MSEQHLTNAKAHVAEAENVLRFTSTGGGAEVDAVRRALLARNNLALAVAELDAFVALYPVADSVGGGERCAVSAMDQARGGLGLGAA